MKVSGRMIRQMGKEFIYIWMGQSTVGNGKRISNMGMGKKRGLMVLSMKVIINMGRSMGLVHLNGQIRACMWESSITIIFREKEYIPGVMAENMKENGNQIKCMVRELLDGKMEEGM